MCSASVDFLWLIFGPIVIVSVIVSVIEPVIVAGRVAPGDRSPKAPTDPDLRDSRIRLLSREIR